MTSGSMYVFCKCTIFALLWAIGGVFFFGFTKRETVEIVGIFYMGFYAARWRDRLK